MQHENSLDRNGTVHTELHRLISCKSSAVVLEDFFATNFVTGYSGCNGSGEVMIGVADCNIMSINTS